MPLDKIISNLAQSKVGQKFCTYIANPKNEKFINSTLPVCQQALAEITGVVIVAGNSKIEPEQKKSQLINHALKATTNLTIVGAASRATASFAQKVAQNLDTRGVPKSVQQGVKVGFPLLTAVLLSRYLIPVLLNPISSKLRDKLNDKILNKKPKNNSTKSNTREAYDQKLEQIKSIKQFQEDMVKAKLNTMA